MSGSSCIWNTSYNGRVEAKAMKGKWKKLTGRIAALVAALLTFITMLWGGNISAPVAFAEDTPAYDATNVLDDPSAGRHLIFPIIPSTSGASRRSSPSPNTVTAFMRITKAITGCMYMSTIRRVSNLIQTPTGTKSSLPMPGKKIGRNTACSFSIIPRRRAMRGCFISSEFP